jgi:uncharacterized protein (TIGR02646 family)
MKFIKHGKPTSHIAAKHKNNTTDWGRLSSQGKKYASSELSTLQYGLCAYCQIRLDDSLESHIEHIKPKHAHPQLTFEWTNLVLSCIASANIPQANSDGGVSCGHSIGKANWNTFDPRFVSPTEPDCERYFEYGVSTGEVYPASDLIESDLERADYTIELLNLNCRRLKRLRRDILSLGTQAKEDVSHNISELQDFLYRELGLKDGKLQSFHSARQQAYAPYQRT